MWPPRVKAAARAKSRQRKSARGVAPGARHGGQGEDQDEDAEVLGVELEGVAAPVAVGAVGGVVEAAELGDDEAGHLLRVEGPAAGVGELLLGRAAGAVVDGGALGLRLDVQVGRVDALGGEAEAEGGGEGEESGALAEAGEGHAAQAQVDELVKEVEARAQEGVLEHLQVGGEHAEGDEDGEGGPRAQGLAAPVHAALDAEAEEGEEGDDRHLGVLAGVREAEEGGGREEGEAAPEGGPAVHADAPQVEEHAVAGGEDDQQVAPAHGALVGREQLDEVGGEELVADLLGDGIAAHDGGPGRGHEVAQLLQDRRLAAVEVRAHVVAEDDLAAEGELPEVDEGHQREEGGGEPGAGDPGAEAGGRGGGLRLGPGVAPAVLLGHSSALWK